MNVVPRDVEVIAVMTDHCSHGMSREAHRLAKVHGCRFVLMGRKRSAWLQGFRLSGFLQKPSWLKPAAGPKVEIKMSTQSANGTTSKPTPAPVPVVTAPAPLPDLLRRAPPHVLPRFVPVSRKNAQAWTKEETEALVKLIQKAPDAACVRTLVADLYATTGRFRGIFAIRSRIEAIHHLVNAPVWLFPAVAKFADESTDTKREALAVEARLLKNTPRKSWPEYISARAADALVGGVRCRLTNTGVKIGTDTLTGLTSFATAEVLAVVEEREARGFPPTAKRQAGPGPAGWEKRILEALRTNGRATSANGLRLTLCGRKAMAALLERGTVVEGVHEGITLYRLVPDHDWPPPARVSPPPRAPAVPTVTAPKPTAPAPAPATARAPVSGFEARRAIIASMRAGELSPAEAASMLAELAR